MTGGVLVATGGGTRDEEYSEYVAARRPQLRRTAYLLCGDVHRAEDLVQTALTKLYVAWPRVQRAGNVDAFVRRIVVNAHLHDRRRPWRRERPGLDGIDPVDPAASGSWHALRHLEAALAPVYESRSRRA